MEGEARSDDDRWALLITASVCVEIPLGGRLFLSEIILLCLLPGLLAARGSLLFARGPRRVLILGALWLAAQVYTDLVRSTPFEDWSRGWSKIAFLLINFAALYLYLAGSHRRTLLMAYGFVLGGILQFLFSPSEYAEALPWKFGVGFAVTLLLVLRAQSILGRLPQMAIALLVGAALANLLLGYRSMAAFCFLTGVLTFYRSQSRRFPLRTLVIVGALSIYSIGQIYIHLASEGILGEEAREKYQVQTSGDFGLLLGARVELFASTQAIIDSPIVGHGSWAKDPEYVLLLGDRLADFGYEMTITSDSELIPSHSYFMSAWVEAGVVGAIFWLFVFGHVSNAVGKTLRRNSELSVLLTFLGVALLWAILFSPFGAEERVRAPYMIALATLALARFVPNDSKSKLDAGIERNPKFLDQANP